MKPTVFNYAEHVALQLELTTLRAELTTLAIESLNRDKMLWKLEAEVKIAARVAEERDAYKEIADGLRGERDAAVADFKEYVNRNVSGTHGVYACDFCKHRDGDRDCKKSPCDGLRKWQWRGADKEANHETD